MIGPRQKCTARGGTCANKYKHTCSGRWKSNLCSGGWVTNVTLVPWKRKGIQPIQIVVMMKTKMYSKVVHALINGYTCSVSWNQIFTLVVGVTNAALVP